FRTAGPGLLASKLVTCYRCPIQDDPGAHPAGAPPSDLGWKTPRRRQKTVGTEGGCPAPQPACSSGTPPAACDPPRPARAPFDALGCRVPRGPAGPHGGIARWPRGAPVLGPAGSRPSHRGGGGRPDTLTRA